MRKFISFTTAKEFLEKSESVLEKEEACNNVLLGISYSLVDNPMRYGSTPFFAVVENDGIVELVALMTPPYKLILYSSGGNLDNSCQLLIENLMLTGLTVSGVIGPNKIADRFNDNWKKINRSISKSSMGMRVYQLTEVIEFEKPDGRFRLAEGCDIPILKEWIDDFYFDVFKNEKNVIKDDPVELIKKSNLYVWDNNGIVSMVNRRRPTNHGYFIGLVYSPKKCRNKGYATANVAALCQHLLNSGKQFCSLFTDLSNPTSNSIYQKIGFKPVCDFYDYSFEEKKPINACGVLPQA